MSVELKDLRIEERPPPRRPALPRGLLLLLPLAFLGGAWLRGAVPGLSPAPVRVETEIVRRAGPASPRGGFGEGGWVEVPSYHPILVSALVPGRVEELCVLEGSRVERGQVVARLYDRDLRDALRVAEAELGEARARVDLVTAGYRKEEVERARAEVQGLATEVRLAEQVLARTRDLLPAGAASAEDLDRDCATLTGARARLRAAEAELARLTAGYREEEVRQARAALARAEAARDLARSRLSYAEVRSPAGGVVLERFVTPGTFLRASDPRVVSLYDPADLQVRVDVRQENADRVRVGQETEVTTEAEPDRVYHGTVIRVEPLADFKKNTVQAKIRLADPSERLHPEMICRVRFLGPARGAGAAPRPPLCVPRSAVRESGGRTFVLLLREGRAVRSEVTLGAARGDRVEVSRGVREGDRVVVSPGDLQGGERVEVSR